jgi:hypothetical protein
MSNSDSPRTPSLNTRVLPSSRSIAMESTEVLVQSAVHPGWASPWFYVTVTGDLGLALGSHGFRKGQGIFARKARNGNYALMDGSGKGGRIVTQATAMSFLKAHRDASGALVPCRHSEKDLNRVWGALWRGEQGRATSKSHGRP